MQQQQLTGKNYSKCEAKSTFSVGFASEDVKSY
jgi:hypothetical protein